MNNKFPGTCAKCIANVPANEGEVFNEDGKWKCYCQNCLAEKKAKARQENARCEILTDGTVFMPYQEESVLLLKAMPGAKWNGEHWKVSVSEENIARTVECALRLKLHVPQELLEKASVKSEQAVVVENAGLYPFQITGVDFLAKRKHALLADEMGLGKTVQALAALNGLTSPVLVICPASLKYNWQDEARKWAPGYKTEVVNGKKAFRTPVAGEMVISNYDIVDDKIEMPADLILVLDEVQYVKNNKATRSKKIATIVKKAAKVIALTGTPLMNRPFDLWGVLNNTGMAYEVFGSWKKFIDLFHGYKNKWGGYEFSNPSPEVPERLRRVMLRRLRADVLPQLPKKTYQTITVNGVSKSLSKLMDEAYKLLDYNKRDLPSFEQFSEIRERLAAERIPAMLEFVENYEEEGIPLLVFSAHVAPIEELEKREGWRIITGGVSAETRQEIVQQFQSGQLKGVGLTITAGGTGLTLTHASHVLFVDLDWVPANNSQAEDRVCRIGQEAEKCQIIRMVSNHALDLHIQKLLVEKIEMANAAIEAKVVIPDMPKPTVVEKVEAMPEDVFFAKKEIVVIEEKKAVEESRPEAEKENVPSEEEIAKVLDQLRFLAGRCDGAYKLDGAGFNRMDSDFGRQLAMLPTLTTKQYHAARGMLMKYRGQLEVLTAHVATSKGSEKSEDIESEPMAAKSPKSIIMKRAWAIAAESAARFGGRKSEYIAQAMKMAWKESK